MDMILVLEQEKKACLGVLKKYNLKYKTPEVQKLFIIYDYLTEKIKNETNEAVKLQLQVDIELIMEYLTP